MNCLAVTSVTAVLAACGGGGGDSTPASYTIGGTVSGLASGTSFVLNDNAGDPLTVSANGSFTFVKNVDANGSYAVTLGTPATGQTCTVSSAAGSGVNANVTTVSVACSPITYPVGGVVSGLDANQTVTLRNNNDATTDYVASANGTYAFVTPVAYNGGYGVSVVTQPTGQTCSVTNPSGSGVTASVTNVNVACSDNTYTVSGTVSGLTGNQQVTLINGSDVAGVAVTGNGAYSFLTPVAYNGGYQVTVNSQPAGVSCTVANFQATGVTTNVSNVNVACSPITYTVSGTVTVANNSDQITLVNNADQTTATPVTGNGTFSFTVPYNGSYSVSLSSAAPTGETCTVNNPTGSNVVANATNLSVVCSVNTYTISGTVSGLPTSQTISLINNNDVSTAVSTGNAAYSFTVAYGSNYGVSVIPASIPAGYSCGVSGQASGMGVTANVGNVNVSCSLNTYTVSGTVSGLPTAQTTISLINNGDVSTSTPFANGPFSFTVPYHGSYGITVSGASVPSGYTCTPANNTGSQVAANVSGVTVSCSLNTYTISGTVTGLQVDTTTSTAQQVTLLNGGDVATGQTAVSGGVTTFSFTVPYGTGYAITAGLTNTAGVTTAGTQPSAETCRISDTSNVATVAADGSKASTTSVTASNTSLAVICRRPLVYVTNGTDGTVSQFQSNFDGSLTAIDGGTYISTNASVTPGTTLDPNQIVVDPTGRYAYVANFGTTIPSAGTIGQFKIDPTTGVLTANGAVATGNNPYGIAIDPAGKYLYQSNQGDGTTAGSVGQYLINGDGTLTLTATLATGVNPYGVTVDPSGTHAYVVNRRDGTISQYTIDGNGGFAAMTPAFVPTFGGTDPLFLAIDATGTNAYVTNFTSAGNGPGSIAQFTFDVNHNLAPTANSTAAGTGPYNLAIAPNGQWAFFADKYDGYEIGCTLTGSGVTGCFYSWGSASPTSQPENSVVDPFSRYVYNVNFNNGAASSVGAYTIDQSTGNIGSNVSAFTNVGMGPFGIATTR